MSIPPPITLLPTELWFLIIANLDLPSLEKAMCAFYSLFRTRSIEPTIRPVMLASLLRWLNDATGTQQLVAKYPFEVVDAIFQLLEPKDKIKLAVGLWQRGREGTRNGIRLRAAANGTDRDNQSSPNSSCSSSST